MTTEPLFTLRPAKAEDSAIAFEWRNDPDARAASWSATPVEWSGHVSWWTESLNADDRVLLIVEADDGAAVGVLRFDRAAGSEWIVSINIAPEARGRGVGTAILPTACGWMERSRDVDAIRAEVRPENRRSMSLFQACGFSLVERDDRRAIFVRKAAESS